LQLRVRRDVLEQLQDAVSGLGGRFEVSLGADSRGATLARLTRDAARGREVALVPDDVQKGGWLDIGGNLHEELEVLKGARVGEIEHRNEDIREAKEQWNQRTLTFIAGSVVYVDRDRPEGH
jgi:hypothetical protein